MQDIDIKLIENEFKVNVKIAIGKIENIYKSLSKDLERELLKVKIYLALSCVLIILTPSRWRRK